MATKTKPKKQPAKPQGKPAAKAAPNKASKPEPKPAKKAAAPKPQPAKKATPSKPEPKPKPQPKATAASSPAPAKKSPSPKAAPQPKPAAAPPSPKAASTTPASPTPSSAPSKSTPTLFAVSQTDGGTRYLTVQDLVDLHKAVALEFGGTAAHPGVVESQFGLVSAVQRPQVTTLGREAYPNFSDKAAALIFALLMARPFKGQNRRVALASLLAFCELNNRAVDTRILDEKSVETLLRRAGSCRELGIPPENVFRELREALGRSIVNAPSQS